MSELRITVAVATMLRVFLEDITEAQYGYDLMSKTGYASGKVYPILARLQNSGILTRDLEAIDPVSEGRPRRALYRLTDQGVVVARNELAALADQLRPPAVKIRRPRLHGEPI